MPGTARTRTWIQLLLLLWVTMGPEAWNKGVGEPCERHGECRSGCCVPNSSNPQRFCTTQTFFLHCSPWHKCQSRCCVWIGYSSERACMAKTIFLQCVPWRKPQGAFCRSHRECLSQCCIRQADSGPRRCSPRTGVLGQCPRL